MRAPTVKHDRGASSEVPRFDFKAVHADSGEGLCWAVRLAVPSGGSTKNRLCESTGAPDRPICRRGSPSSRRSNRRGRRVWTCRAHELRIRRTDIGDLSSPELAQLVIGSTFSILELRGGAHKKTSFISNPLTGYIYPVKITMQDRYILQKLKWTVIYEKHKSCDLAQERVAERMSISYRQYQNIEAGNTQTSRGDNNLHRKFFRVQRSRPLWPAAATAEK